jgi:hypothetical protein
MYKIAFRPIRRQLTADEAYRFRAHPAGAFAVHRGGDLPTLPPGHGAVVIDSGWRTGLPSKVAEQDPRMRSSKTDEDPHLPRSVRHLSDREAFALLRRGPRPFCPVFLVDGVPAATGFGTGAVVVPAGRRLVQAQSGVSGPYWPVEVPDGGVVRLESVTTKLRHITAMEGRPIDSYRDMALAPAGSARVREGRWFRTAAAGLAASWATRGRFRPTSPPGAGYLGWGRRSHRTGPAVGKKVVPIKER